MDLFTGKEFILTVYVVLKRHYPDFEVLLAQIPDYRGRSTWQVYALEAKLLCQAGFSISLANEWLSNSEGVGDKQDCELKAFYRLAGRLKKLYPRLPMILLADSLYPNRTVFEICRGNSWRFIFTFPCNRYP